MLRCSCGNVFASRRSLAQHFNHHRRTDPDTTHRVLRNDQRSLIEPAELLPAHNGRAAPPLAASALQLVAVDDEVYSEEVDHYEADVGDPFDGNVDDDDSTNFAGPPSIEHFDDEDFTLADATLPANTVPDNSLIEQFDEYATSGYE